MNRFRIVVLLLFVWSFSFGQLRDDIYQFSIYQIGTISKFHLVEKGQVVQDLKNLPIAHLSAITNVVVGKAYLQMDLSSFLVRLTHSSREDDHSSFLGSYGRYLNLNNPINLGSKADLIVGIHGFMDLSNTVINSTRANLNEKITVFGGGLVLDLLLGERWNLKNQFDYGRTNGASKFAFTSRIAFRLIGRQWVTITPKYSSYQLDKDDRELSISGTYLLFGLARNI